MARPRKERKEGESDPIVKHWLAEIEASRKRDEWFRKDGERIRNIYAGEKKDATPFNVLFSNVETISPALYSQVPRPVVQYRFKDGNPIGVAAAKAAQRILEFQLDTNVEGYETFNDAMKAAVNDALLPGRGFTTVKYDSEVVDVPDEDAAEDKGVEDDADEGVPTTPVKNYELICTDGASWNRVYIGYAKKWSKVPWVAYEMYVDKSEAKRMFPESVNKITFTKGQETENGQNKKQDDRYLGERKTALVYKIWDKSDRKIKFISPQYNDGYLSVMDDPLELTGFFDCPRPLQFVEKTDDMVPTAMYTLYENQAQELNSLSVRINRIIKSIKAKALYDGALGSDLDNLMSADETSMTPTESDVLSIEKGMDKGIWFWPVEKLIVVLRELYAAREACKQVIYEVTGISDIVRGASKASETLGAQQIKSQWGTLRIKPKQAEVQRYARDMLRMMLEIAANKFSQETWAKMTGLPYLTDMQVQQAQMMVQAAQQAMQTMPPPMPGAPPDPRAAQSQQAIQQAQAELQKPKWADVIRVLQDDIQRAYKIDIETNSTIEPEAAEDQKNISDLMMAIGQFLNGTGPMIAQGIMPFETVQSMLMAIVRRFRFGNEIEDQIRNMKPPKPQDDGKAEAAQKQQQQAAQQQAQAQQKATQDAATIAQLKTQLEQTQAMLDLQKRDSDLTARENKLATEQAVFKIEQKVAGESLQNRAALEGTKLDHKKQITGLESKQAKTEQVVGKAVDSKMAQSVQQMGQMIQQLVDTVTQQAESTQQLVKAVSAPRRRKAIRGPDGNIAETVDEVMQ
ncbi:MAG: hypothetical protein ABL964_10030 [Steroidobacteraceae bacterium]